MTFGAPGLKGEKVFDDYVARLSARPGPAAHRGGLTAAPMATPGPNRRLATILFADIDGYSRLMRADEERTLDDLHAHLAELVGPVVERFHGRIVKTVGDGVLVEFASAVEAVRSAVELQRGMVERNVGTPAERRQAFRIGLHLGDIIVSDEDVFGDTVNLAARLQGLAEPGSIVLSASVYEQVRDKLALPFRSQGSRTLKNIDRPIQIYSLTAAALSETGAAAAKPAPARRRMMAVAALAVVVALVAGGAGAYLTGRVSSTEEAARGERPAVDRKRPVGRRPGVRQPERRCGPGLFLRRPHRGHHPRARPLQGADGDRLWRGAALPQQGAAAGGNRPCAERPLSRERQRAPRGPAGQGHRAADRRGQRHPALVRPVRRRAERHLRRPGAHRPPRRRHAGLQPAADRPAAEPAQADRQSRRLRPGAARPCAGRRSDARSPTARRASCSSG